MKKIILIALLVSSFTMQAQTLKDLLYKGKLKSDTGSVVRKTDDLSAKIDTTTKKPAEPEKVKAKTIVTDSIGNKQATMTDSVATTAAGLADNAATVKDNNKLWKEFVDTVISTLNAEVMNGKKVKKGDYYVLVDYTIATDGQVTVTNVFVTPENKFLADQVKERLSISTPRLNPVLTSTGTARKTSKRYNFTLTGK